MDITTLLFAGLQLLLQGFIINYLFQLEKTGCECAMDYKRTYILSYLVINMVFVVLSMFSNILKYTSNNKVGSFLLSLYSVGGLLNIAFIIEYVNMLKAKKCNCSESVYRDLMYVFAIIDALVLGLAVLIAVYIILFSAKVNGGKGGKGGKVSKVSKGRKLKR